VNDFWPISWEDWSHRTYYMGNKTPCLGAHSGSLNKTLVARSRKLGASGDRAPVRQQPWVDLGDDITKSHRNVHVTMEDGTVWPCQEGIDTEYLLDFVSIERGNYHCQNFLQHLPLQFKKFSWSNVGKHFKELKQSTFV